MAISLNESIVVGFSDFWSRKVRSAVTILGIVLGTMSIIVVLSLITAVKKQTIQWILERGGLNRLSVERNWEYREVENEREYFTPQEVEYIRSQVPEAKYFNTAVHVWSRDNITYKGKQADRSNIIGVMPDNVYIEEWFPYPDGRFINDFDVAQASDVIVIGTNIRDEVFGNENPVGKYVTYHGRRFLVIGVMTFRYMKGNGIMGENQLDWMNSTAYLPVTTVTRKLSNQYQINTIELKTNNPRESALLKAKLDDLLLNMRHNKPVFVAESAQEQADEMSRNMRVFSLVFFLISAISLFVGGIVIMNIMLATIRERTREIGVRLAVGARRFDIFMQFMVQTVLMTTLGGIIGVGAGLSILSQVGKWLKMETAATPGMIVIAVTISAGVGLVFGILPAIHASNLNPVKALRYE